jgi:hypothetical protein
VGYAFTSVFSFVKEALEIVVLYNKSLGSLHIDGTR